MEALPEEKPQADAIRAQQTSSAIVNSVSY